MGIAIAKLKLNHQPGVALHMQECSTGPSRARRLADSLIVVLAIFLALHQYSPTRALALVALRRNRSCLLATMMDGDREVRRQILARADKRRRSNLKSECA